MAGSLRIGERTFAWGERTYLMGIINVTPDSFSGDGVVDPAQAAALARRLEADGADIIDLGAESSRPGAAELEPGEELARLLPALQAVRAATRLPLSVDTCHAGVAAAALEAGADAINDIWGLRNDPGMAPLAAAHAVPVFAMHNQRGRPPGEVVSSVRAGFEATLAIAARAGLARERLVLDPGFGFGWKPEENLELVRRLAELRVAGLPLLVGPSRKSTIGYVLGGAPASARLEGTAAAVALSIANGADVVRVHDVAAMARVARVADAIVRGHWRQGPGDATMTTVVLALGSNLGDRLGNLRAAVTLLADAGLRVTARSAIWETAPLPAGQPDFLNAAAAAETRLEPEQLLVVAKGIERALGRRPGARWGPRPIDIDILFFGDRRISLEALEIPHPRIAERAFVLAPLAEVYPGGLPVLGATAAELLAPLDRAGLRRTAHEL